ncbi:MAG: sigma-70 family RNA polymerase sigma factor [Ruminococcaceae bacterium]|nr:sigma-70 family RNA polymerase sigma factor [Oscillospiraceae bacterium]
MDIFENLLCENMISLERFVRFRISDSFDAQDIIQESCIAAYKNFQQLKNKDAFKGWLLRIAANKCNDYYSKKAKTQQLSDSFSQFTWLETPLERQKKEAVLETLKQLNEKDRQILYLFFFCDWSQDKIAEQLRIPVGTVKSRLHYAKKNFKHLYPEPFRPKGEKQMKKLPDILPPYTIEKSDLPPFDVRCEELRGFCILLKVGSYTTWGCYEQPHKALTQYTSANVTQKAEIHGIQGVEIVAEEHIPTRDGKETVTQRQYVAQLTDTHCRYLAESHIENGVKRLFTFLDSDIFAINWGLGEDNCGFETNITAKGIITQNDSVLTTDATQEVTDIVGRYKVTICGKTYDTVCAVNIGHYAGKIVIEQYLDQNGRTVLWRRFNRNDWAYHRYGKLWTDILPDSETLTVNGETYVHWYDCITDYIL